MLGAITIDVIKEQEDGKCLISCPSLPVYTFGKNEQEAESNLPEAVSLFLECCAYEGTLPKSLTSYLSRKPRAPMLRLAESNNPKLAALVCYNLAPL